MDIATSFKILILIFWPFLLMFIYYLYDKEGFKKQLEKFKKEGFF